VEVKNTLGGPTCIMNYNFQYSKSGREEYLEGTYLGKYEPVYQSNPPGKWGDCGGGKVFLRKVTKTDFYLEPFLRNKIRTTATTPVIVNQPPVKINPPANKPVVKTNPPLNKPVTKITTPVTKPVTKNPVVKTNPITKPVTKINTPLTKPVIDTTQKNPASKISPTSNVTPKVLLTRTNELVKGLMISAPEVTVKLFDNGEIDGDTVSVFLDKKLVLGSKRLTASPLTVKFKIDEDNDEHELVMVAENLGRIPPNTSLMVVEAGEQRFNVYITSTEQKNAVVRFKYQKPQ